MYATRTLLATLFAASVAFAAPTPTSTAKSSGSSSSVSSESADWAIQGLVRECTEDNSSCTWTFGIFDGATTTDCTYIVDGPDVHGGPTMCGDFQITSDYISGSPGWNQVSVVRDGLIIYPAYDDDVLANPPVADITQAPQPTWTP